VANEALVNEIKQIMALAKSGDMDGSNERWGSLFANPTFTTNRPEDQRQALKLFVLAKRTGDPAPSLIEAHRAAMPPLEALVDAVREPADYEMLGICQVLCGSEELASATFRAGLEIERAKDADSDLCGRLMKHVASI
jgi:hypothetical protein